MPIEIPAIGMRNIKTAIAVCVCVLISQALHLEYPFYAAIAAIISLDSSLTASYKAGKNRILATFVGAGIGLLCALINPDNALLCGLGIVVLIYVCNLLKWKKTIATAGIVFLAIMLNLKGRSPVLYSINRILDTLIGVVVAVVVNYTINPPHQSKAIAGLCRDLYDECHLLINDYIVYGNSENLNKYMQSVELFDTKLSAFCADHYLLGKEHPNLPLLHKSLELSRQILNHMQFITEMKPSGIFLLDRKNVEKLQNLFNQTSDTRWIEPSDENEVIVNYHTGRILDYLKDFKEEVEKLEM